MAIPHKRSHPLLAQNAALENGAHEEAWRNLLKPLAGRAAGPPGINGGHMTKLTARQSSPEEGVLLRELNHRISNEYASAIGLVSLAAARSGSEEIKIALTGITELLHHYADVHHALEIPEHHTRIDASAYLRQLCRSISRSKLDFMKIELVLAATPLQLQSDRCWLLGMIVYELVTNAARHAFPGVNGEIRVELLRARAFVQCTVLDNGSAPASVQPGRGLKIVGELIKGLDGRFKQKFGSRGSTSILVFPYINEPQRTGPRKNQTMNGAGLAADRTLPRTNRKRPEKGSSRMTAQMRYNKSESHQSDVGTYSCEKGEIIP
jgi:two-component sensor histidine kinase